MTKCEDRLGAGDVDALKRHPFFTNIDWANLHLIKAPFVINETLQINSAIFANPLPPPVSII